MVGQDMVLFVYMYMYTNSTILCTLIVVCCRLNLNDLPVHQYREVKLYLQVPLQLPLPREGVKRRPPLRPHQQVCLLKSCEVKIILICFETSLLNIGIYYFHSHLAVACV